MEKNITSRVLSEADYMIKTEKTIREIASIYHVSKSTVHKDLQERLKKINKKKYQQVDEILKYHINVRHIRGGNSTKKKYQNLTFNYKS